MKKGIIRTIKIHRDFGLNYNGYVKFQIGDKIYESSNIEIFLRDYRNKYHNIENITGCDFKVLSEYKQDDGFVFEIELISSVFNPNRTVSYLNVIIN